MTLSDSLLAADGLPVRTVTLGHSAGLRLSLTDWGASWSGCTLALRDGRQRQLLLGYRDQRALLRQQAFLGASLGRFANRIAQGRYPGVDGWVQLACQPGSSHCLHGGPDGFDRRRWQIRALRADEVCFGLESPDGDQGFPGALEVEIRYQLSADNEITIDYRASSDALTPINLSNHAYFNLDEAAHDILNHHLQLTASRYLPIDQELIPLGMLADVAGTSMDFRAGKRLGLDFLSDEQQQRAHGYDHAFLLDCHAGARSCPALTLASSDRRLQMELFTSMPAIHVYSGNYLQGTPARGGGVYHNQQGLALETEWLPDSPNHPEWPQPSCLLPAGVRWRQQTRYRFSEC